jgi:hypothetical protein
VAASSLEQPRSWPRLGLHASSASGAARCLASAPASAHASWGVYSRYLLVCMVSECWVVEGGKPRRRTENDVWWGRTRTKRARTDGMHQVAYRYEQHMDARYVGVARSYDDCEAIVITGDGLTRGACI